MFQKAFKCQGEHNLRWGSRLVIEGVQAGHCRALALLGIWFLSFHLLFHGIFLRVDQILPLFAQAGQLGVPGDIGILNSEHKIEDLADRLIRMMDIDVLNFGELILLLIHLLVYFLHYCQAFHIEFLLMLHFLPIFGFTLIRHRPSFLPTLRFLLLLLIVLPLNFLQQMFLASLEHRVLERILLILLPSFMKIVHVQLHLGIGLPVWRRKYNWNVWNEWEGCSRRIP